MTFGLTPEEDAKFNHTVIYYSREVIDDTQSIITNHNMSVFDWR